MAKLATPSKPIINGTNVSVGSIAGAKKYNLYKVRYVIPERYVSLGDSIAAGHMIDELWDDNYGEGSQYGNNGNTSTALVPYSYTDRIREKMRDIYGENVRVDATSFARSGDRVSDLIIKLSHPAVIEAIKNASLVTVCIGANDVLEPAMSNLGAYIEYGDAALVALEQTMKSNMDILSNDNDPNSYTSLFNRLYNINPNAKYVFTTVYNPYKYLWVDEGKNGFFGPLLSTIPDINLLGLDIDGMIKSNFINSSMVQKLFSRVNGLNYWVEKCLEGGGILQGLNTILRTKLAAYQTTHPNFILADTKPVFDSFPDRQVSAPKHYNELVSVEYTRGYDVARMNWGALWHGSNSAAYWINLANKYLISSGMNIEGLVAEVVEQTIEKVIVPDVDPHPTSYGHEVLYRAFADALGWQSLSRYTITYDANGGSGYMATQQVVGVDNIPAFTTVKSNTFSPTTTGYHFVGWKNQNGIDHSNGQLIGITSDVIMYAQWSNMYTVIFNHQRKVDTEAELTTPIDMGPQDCYAFWIAGEEQADLGAFSNGPRVYTLPYNTMIGAVVKTKKGSGNSFISISVDGVESYYSGTGSEAAYSFPVIGTVTLNYEWVCTGVGGTTSYWNCRITIYT